MFSLNATRVEWPKLSPGWCQAWVDWFVPTRIGRQCGKMMASVRDFMKIAMAVTECRSWIPAFMDFMERTQIMVEVKVL